ncbi:MAG: sulfatase [Verrucomicrobiota bacterium]|nr:sulfatase [Verrucomicrobiota bacterium]
MSTANPPEQRCGWQKIFMILSLSLGVACCELQGADPSPTQPNILFIAIDDLRPELGCYGAEKVHSPHIDQLAADGLKFNRAYCQQAICSPSRASLMTGLYPHRLGVIENTTYFRDLHPDLVTLPQHFRRQGYETVYCGKIFHGRMTDEPLSWSRKPSRKGIHYRREATPGGYALKENQELWRANREQMVARYGQARAGGLFNGPAYEAADVPDHAYVDGFQTDLAIATLKEHTESKPEQPLFLALGFQKPHLNFVAPKRYWDLYDPASLPLAEDARPPLGGATMGLHASFELRTRAGIPKQGPLDSSLQRKLIHGYYACISYVDAQIGKMMQALKDTQTRRRTVIVLWGDHGWHLGDMGIWGKATNYEIATRVPLLVWAPDMPRSGQTTQALVELIDLYPSLCELAGLPTPTHCQGRSFVPLLKNPHQSWKTSTLSQYPNPALREWAANPLSEGMRATFFGPLIEEVEKGIMEQMKEGWDRNLFEQHLMGLSLRTDRYRFVSWRDTRNPLAPGLFTELYDHGKDPQESFNLVHEMPDIVRRLQQELAGYLKPNP